MAELCGHHYDPDEVAKYLAWADLPRFGAAAPSIADSGKGKVVCLWQFVRQVLGHDLIHNQTIGDCVSHGFGLSVDVVKCVRIAQGKREDFTAETSTEAIYALSRVEVGHGSLGGGDGSCGSWAAEALQKYGTLIRKKYDGVDLTRYDGDLARQWGRPRAGLPDALEPIAREHTVLAASLVETVEQARDAIANGYPIGICSNQGFTSTRDSEGMARPRGSWSHCMAIIGVDDPKGRFCIMNSWGPDWISGGKAYDQPDGSFWTDYETVGRMLGNQPDSYAISDFAGFPANDDLAEYMPW